MNEQKGQQPIPAHIMQVGMVLAGPTSAAITYN